MIRTSGIGSSRNLYTLMQGVIGNTYTKLCQSTTSAVQRVSKARFINRLANEFSSLTRFQKLCICAIAAFYLMQVAVAITAIAIHFFKKFHSQTIGSRATPNVRSESSSRGQAAPVPARNTGPSAVTQFSAEKIIIDPVGIRNDPVAILRQLRGVLSLKKPFTFPQVKYIECGQVQAGLDYGGIRRDFVTRLLIELFNSKNSINVEAGKGQAFVPASNSPELLPVLSYLIAYCVESNNKPGPIFQTISLSF